MKLPASLAIAGLCLVMVCLAGCSTTSDHIGSDSLRLKVGQTYVLKRDAILLANRGTVNSIENPDYTLENYKANQDNRRV